MSVQNPVNILLVDDQPAKLLSYELILEGLGETLIKAGSASEALQDLLKFDIAVVLIDVCMPDLDGFELAAMIREHPRFQQIAIIFVSAVQVQDLDLLRGYELGAVDYVPVPVVPAVLRAKVKVFAELHRKTRQLENLNAELEGRVALRTADLAQANAELERRVEERTREREIALSQVHEMQKLESLGQLTGGVAHDFNNLLMAILGNLHLVKKYFPDDPKAQRLLDGALQGAERGATLTKRMLAFARRQELKPEIVYVDRLVDGMLEMLRRSLGPTIQIATQCETNIGPVRVDPNQLELAILNLALNSRDAMQGGGHLKIAVRSAVGPAGETAGPATGNFVCLSVQDTGAGMDAATAKRATEPFFTTKGVGKGTGLGLSMVDGFVAQSGGTMKIDSRPGKGTTIELWLSVTTPDAVALTERKDSKSSASSRSCHILIVDDDILVSSGTAAMVEDLGHSVTEASSGAAALDLLSSGATIDLVLTDHAMPGMTGIELASRIKRRWPALPVILASGYADLPAGGEDRELPRLSKPYYQDELAAVINAVIGDHEISNVIPISASRP